MILYKDDWISGWFIWIGFLYILLILDDGNDMVIIFFEKKNYIDYKEIESCLFYNLYIYIDFIRVFVLFFCYGILNGCVWYSYLVVRDKLL